MILLRAYLYERSFKVLLKSFIMIMKTIFSICVVSIFFSCNHRPKNLGSIERIDPDLDFIIKKNAKIEIIAEGMDWSEGPVWVESHKMLLFSDVPADAIYKWTSEQGKELYLHPSGYTDSVARGGEMGSNGLLLNKEGRLVLCQHGNRQMAWMDADLDHPKPEFKTIAANYQGKRFNSPNDAVYDSSGNLYFTDPPYGLENNMQDTLKEIPFQGVYKVKPSGEVVLLVDSLTRPNGLALTPDERTLIIANSDRNRLRWYAYDLSGDSLKHGRIFYDATAAAGTLKGSADGMKIDRKGNIFATGPGGVWIFDRKAKVLGKILFPEATSNCALSPDQKTLYVTADMYVLRIKMR